jgi:hypothetical protein
MLQRKIQKILGIESDNETEFGAFVFTLRPASSAIYCVPRFPQ